jgi:hypothetical protein
MITKSSFLSCFESMCIGVFDFFYYIVVIFNDATPDILLNTTKQNLK